MLYFKNKTVVNLNSHQLEMSLRKASIKRLVPLDLVSSLNNTGTKKEFLGYESKNGLMFKRIKAALENALPTIIIKLSPSTGNGGYQMRLSAISMVVFVSLTSFWIFGLLTVIVGQNKSSNMIGLIAIYLFYWILLFTELKLTQRKVNKAAEQYSELCAQGQNQPLR